MPDQTTPATEAEVASETTPTVDVNKQLAEQATAYLDKDRVTRAQAEAYRELLTSGETGDPMEDFLPGVDIEDAIAYAGKSKATPTELRDSLRSAYSDLKPSHQWLKAVIATAVALHQEMQEEGEEPDSK
jgi:hypothetical protein